MKLPFTKMHGTGNDFVVIDATRERFRPSPALLARLTDRRFGVGCDQVLVIESPSSADVDFDYRIFNADGSEVAQCGNGTRALARYVADNGLSTKRRLRVRTSAALMEIEHLDDGRVRVDMGAPRFDPAAVPLSVVPRADRYRLDVTAAGIEFGAVSFGNPHAVLLVDNVDTAPVDSLGPAIQARAEFPQGVNVGFLQIIDRGRARLRVYERGAGETLACGSGACAAMAVGRLWGLLDASVTLQMRGGELTLEWSGNEAAPVLMTGPAETVFRGEIEWPS